jgi:hypothetical protein
MRTLTCAGAIITLAFATAANAQPPQTPPGQVKKQTAPHQTPDHGDSDAWRDLTPEEQAVVDRLYGKNEAGATLTLLANGAVRADLDESFMEATTVTRAVDGSLEFGHTTGLANAAMVVKAAADVKKDPTVQADPKKPAKLEEKE